MNKKDLLNDLRRVGNELDKTPTAKEYNKHGKYASRTITDNFDSWNDAITTIGREPNESHYVDSKYLCEDVRQIADELGRTPVQEEYDRHGQYTSETLRRRFGSWWESVVRSGLKPRVASPISPIKYESFIEAAIDHTDPSVSLHGLIRSFTGIQCRILREFELTWVSRVESDLQETLLTVPSEHIASDDDWVMILPAYYTTESGKEKPTKIDPLLRWLNEDRLRWPEVKNGVTQRIASEAGIQIDGENLRATVASHLIRKGSERGVIEMQIGAERTDWKRSVEDYFLYTYQFQDYCHPDYKPSGTYLDPDTGEPQRIESDAN